MRIGHGFDVHAFAENRKLVLCGITIEHNRGLLGHSDADVATHALMDALLGALALGDIGKHFPDTQEKYRGANSLALLAQVHSLIKEQGYALGNADITLLCEKPRLAPYIDEMRAAIAGALHADIDQISVKATTTEKLGFTGREEGIAAHAVVLLAKETE